MKRLNLEELIVKEENRLKEDPIRATVGLMTYLIKKHYAGTRITGQELASACLLCSLDHDLGWKLYWKLSDRYKAIYGTPYTTGEADEDMGFYRIDGLKMITKALLNEEA